jgi:nitroreductase
MLARLLHAAHSAPSVGPMQRWRFIRITDAVMRTRIHALVDEERLRDGRQAMCSADAPCRETRGAPLPRRSPGLAAPA